MHGRRKMKQRYKGTCIPKIYDNKIPTKQLFIYHGPLDN